MLFAATVVMPSTSRLPSRLCDPAHPRGDVSLASEEHCNSTAARIQSILPMSFSSRAHDPRRSSAGPRLDTTLIQPYSCINMDGSVQIAPPDFDRVFAALADHTRRDIVRRAISAEEGVLEL